MEILKYFVEERKISDEVKMTAYATLQSMANSIASILSRRGESASERLGIRRLRSLQRAPRVRKLLARKRVSRTNGRSNTLNLSRIGKQIR